MTEQNLESPEGYVAPKEVDYTAVGPDYDGNLYVIFDEDDDVEYLLVFSNDEVATHEGEYWFTPDQDTFTYILDHRTRKVKEGLEEDLITAWETNEGRDEDGSYFSVEQLTPFFD